MPFTSLPSLRAASIKHHDRALTLVFGSDGQVSLISFDDGTTSQASHTLAASNTGTPIPVTRSLSSESSSFSPIPNLEATSASLTATSSFTPTPTSSSVSSSLTSSSYGPSSTTTDTDTNLPSIPTVNYPTPSPTPVSDPKDHGVGAPFYLAIVLASISFIGCVAAFIAWWIRSRARKHDLELDDPWNHRDTLSDTGSPFTDSANALEKGASTHGETQTRPYYLPASIVRRGSPNLLAVPHTIPALEYGTSRDGISHAVQDVGRYPSLRRANDPRSHSSGSESSPHQNMPLSKTTSPYSRPGTERLQSGLSVQESTRTLGRLRVANRVPGDVTSGDEGGTNVPRLQTAAGLSAVVNAGAAPVGGNAMPNNRSGQGDAPMEPPGPATVSWGRRTDNVAALRRTRRRAPESTVQTYKNARYGGYLYPTRDEGPSGTWQAPAAVNQEETERVHANLLSEPLDWKSTLKSSFWQAVDAMTGSRPLGPESHPASTGSGSGFTPAPQRVASRRSPVSPIRPATGSTLSDTKYGPTLPDKPVATEEIYQNLTHSNSSSSTTKRDESEVPRISEVTIGSPPPRMSHLNLGVSARKPHLDSLNADTGSVYSTDSAAARANLRKYGYGDPIPSSWSALGAARESQLDLEHMYLPLPRPIPSLSPSPLSITPSQLTLDSGPLSSARTPINVNPANHGETMSSTYGMSRHGTTQSGRSTVGQGAVPLPPPSTTSSMLSRKKGVTARRKRPAFPQRTPSSASSVQSIDSRLSIRDVAVRRALLERRKKVKAMNSLKDHEDGLMRSRDASSSLGNDMTT